MTLTTQQKILRSSPYFATFILIGMAAAVVGPALPALGKQTGATLSALGSLFTFRALGYLVGSGAGGRLYDRLPGHRVMLAAALVIALTLVLVPQANSLAWLGAILLVLGIAEGALDLGGNLNLIWGLRQGVAPYLNALHFFFGIGAFIAPLLIASLLGSTQDIRPVFYILAAASLPVLALLAWIPSPTREAQPAVSKEEGKVLFVPVLLVTLFYLLYVGAEVSYGGWISTYALLQAPLNEAQAAVLTSGFWGAFTAARLLGIAIASRVSPGRILAADLAICVASLTLPLAFPGSLAALWAGTLGLGIGMASVYATMLAYVETFMEIRGSVAAWFLIGTGLGGMTVPWLIGQLSQALGPQMVMWVILGVLLLDVLAFVGVWVYLPRSRQSKAV